MQSLRTTLRIATVLVAALASTVGCLDDRSNDSRDCDWDQDGFLSSACGGADCNERDSRVWACGQNQECRDGQCVVLDCQDRGCGQGDLGSWCGGCAYCGQSCREGTCVFTACDGRTCGPDPSGCQTSCGTCDSTSECLEGTCQACEPGGCGDGCLLCEEGWGTCDDLGCRCNRACIGRHCGDDGCGGACGTCAVGEVCADGSCLPFDASAWSAFRIDSTVSPGTLEMPEDDPCWEDADGDGTPDPIYGSGYGYTSNDPDAGAYKLVLFPSAIGDSTAAFEAWFVWGDPVPGTDEFRVASSALYGRPAPVAVFKESTLAEGVLTTGLADLQVFDATVMREGTYNSATNAFALIKSYLPVRDAVISGPVTFDDAGSARMESGILKGTLRRSDLEHAVRLARDHCAESGHGSGTCEALNTTPKETWFFRASFYDVDIDTSTVGPLRETVSFCAWITGAKAEIVGVQPVR